MARTPNRSPEQIEKIKQRIECMRTAIDMLQYMIDHPDVAERQIVDQFGIDYSQYRKYVYRENWMTDKPETSWNRSEDIMKQPTLVWQEQLWLDIHKLGVHDLEAIPIDVIETIDEALHEMMNNSSAYVRRHARLLIMHYRDRMTYEEIKKFESVSKNTVREQTLKALRIMRETSPYINFGRNQMIHAKHVAEQLHEENLKLVEIAIANIRDEMTPKISIDTDVEQHPQHQFSKPDFEPTETSIDELDLSVRTKNCLNRAGINTISDIFKRSKREISSIRSFGQKCYDELFESLKEHGFEIYIAMMDYD